MFGMTALTPGVVLSPNMVPHSNSMMLLLYSIPYIFLPISDMPPKTSVRISPRVGFGMNTFFGFLVAFVLPFNLDDCVFL